jgi:RNA polymerase sigma-70 factor (ECF subfamily)
MSERTFEKRIIGFKGIRGSVSGLAKPAIGVIKLFNAGNEQAYNKIYNLLYPHVFYFACRFVDREDAADIVANSFAKLWKVKKNFESVQKIRIFLQVCARNACITHLERIKTWDRIKGDLLAVLNESDSPVEQSEEARSALLHKIYEEIEKLPPRARIIFKMSVIDGMESLEIGQKLGIAESTVRNQKKRALAALRLAIGVSIPAMLILMALWILLL